MVTLAECELVGNSRIALIGFKAISIPRTCVHKRLKRTIQVYALYQHLNVLRTFEVTFLKGETRERASVVLWRRWRRHCTFLGRTEAQKNRDLYPK